MRYYTFTLPFSLLTLEPSVSDIQRVALTCPYFVGEGGFATKPRIRFEFVWTHAQCMPTFRVNACAVHAWSLYRMVKSARGGSAYRVSKEARAALQLISARQLFCRCDVGHLSFFFLFFLQFFGRLGELVDLQRYHWLWFVWNLWEQGWEQRLEKLGQLCNVEDVRLVDSQSEFNNVEVSELSCASFVVTVDRRDF